MLKLNIPKIITLFFCVVMVGNLVEKLNSDCAITNANRKTMNRIDDLVNYSTLEAKYTRSVMAWNEACSPLSNQWPKGLRQAVLEASFVEMEGLNKTVPGYREVKNTFEFMNKARVK